MLIIPQSQLNSMNKSFIISSNNSQLAEQKVLQIKNSLQVGSLDYLVISPQGQNIKIEQIKQLISWSSLKPFHSPSKLVLIEQAEKMTPEAQNALLKTLEEPNRFTSIILLTSNYKLLLPTVISRCQIEEINQKQDDNQQLAEQFVNSKLLDRFMFIDQIFSLKESAEQKTRLDELLVSLVNHYRKAMFHKKSAFSNVKLVNETMKKLKANVAKRLLMENLVINLKK